MLTGVSLNYKITNKSNLTSIDVANYITTGKPFLFTQP